MFKKSRSSANYLSLGIQIVGAEKILSWSADGKNAHFIIGNVKQDAECGASFAH